jgi:hypothetical protein
VPDGAQFIVGKNAVALGDGAPAHASNNRRAKFIRSARVPVHHPAQVRKRERCHARPALVLNGVEQLVNVRPLYLVDLARAQLWKDQPFKGGTLSVDGAKLAALAGEVVLDDSPQGVSGFCFGFPPFLCRIVAVGHLPQDALRERSSLLWRDLSHRPYREALLRHRAPRANSVAHNIGHGAARTHTYTEPRQLRVPNRVLRYVGFQAVNDALADPLAWH